MGSNQKELFRAIDHFLHRKPFRGIRCNPFGKACVVMHVLEVLKTQS